MIPVLPPIAAKWVFLALLIVLAYGAGQIHGRGAVQAEWRSDIAAQSIIATRTVTKQGEVTVRVVKEYVDRIKVVEGVTTTIEKEVVRYVSPAADAGCVVPVGFVRVHDAAASGAVPETAPGDYDSASGVALSAVASTVNANYGEFHKVAARLTACQAFVRGQYEATNGEPLRYDKAAP